jgi:ribosomal protein S18 acetylase RimI-like enzyme
MMKIRNAKKEDIPLLMMDGNELRACRRVYSKMGLVRKDREINRLFKKKMLGLIQGRNGTILMAEKDGETVGFIALEAKKAGSLINKGVQGHILSVGTFGKQRKPQVLKSLMSAGMGFLLKRGAGQVTTTINLQNKAHERLFQGFGFQRQNIVLSKRLR